MIQENLRHCIFYAVTQEIKTIHHTLNHSLKNTYPIPRHRIEQNSYPYLLSTDPLFGTFLLSITDEPVRFRRNLWVLCISHTLFPNFVAGR